MESILVVKVKCGDTLRRFNTFVAENGDLGLNVEQLREKIRSLFNLSVEDDFTLTYTDTDGDSVTIVEDCDLDDMVLQRLNPVRMALTLKTADKSGSFNVGSFGATDSPRIYESIENIRTSVENVLKTVPEPLRGVLLKLTRDLAATASAPVVAEIIHSASKIGESFVQMESSVETKVAEGETSSGFPGSMGNTGAEVKGKENDSGVCRVPDLNHAPPSPVIAASPNGIRVRRCPMFANGGSLNVDAKAKPFSGCPFSKARADFGSYTTYKGDRSTQFKRSHSRSVSGALVSHKGVQCDECAVHPITGPRFKSKVRHDYDLCSLCYQKSGNEADYVRIDSPMLYHHIMKALQHHGVHGPQFQGYGPFKPIANPWSTWPTVSQASQIWRMQNIGNVVWPVGTKLVWIDGDKFSYALSVDLEIPANGVPVESELDVAVDFVAPELPGEYISHWRMSSASGQKFGQRVWVAIQVVDASPYALSDNFNRLNLNVPPHGDGHNNPVIIDINFEPPMNNTYSPSNLYPAEVPVTTDTISSQVVDQHSNTTVTPLVVEPVSEYVTVKGPTEAKDQNLGSQGAASEMKGSASNDQDLNFPINDFLLVGDAFSNATAPSVFYPVVDSSKIEAGAMPGSASSNVENITPVPQSVVFNETEELLLKQLSDMGFSQVDLNREILRKNEFDLEKTVVDLWDISEWDPFMDELEEMGFSDKKKNAILLVKNKGSIKRVVMDLVSEDQSQ